MSVNCCSQYGTIQKKYKDVIMTVDIRDLEKNSNILDEYYYVDVEDKKTKKYIGLFISPKYAEEIKKLIGKKISKENSRLRVL